MSANEYYYLSKRHQRPTSQGEQEQQCTGFPAGSPFLSFWIAALRKNFPHHSATLFRLLGQISKFPQSMDCWWIINLFYEKQIFKVNLSPLKVRKSRSPTSLNMTKPTSSDSPFLFNQDWASTVEGDSASVSRAKRLLFHILGLLRQVGCFLFHCMGIFEKAKIFHILGIFWQARWFFFHISI